MRIRRAEVGDARRVAVVHVDSWRAAYAGLVADDVIAELSVDGQEAAWRARLGEQDDRAWTLVAEDEERLLGFCSLAAGSTGPGGAGDEVGSGGSGDEDGARRAGEIAAAYVDPGSWRAGVGTALVTAGLTGLGAVGCGEVRVWILAGNTPGEAFYRRFGFVPDGAEQVRERSGVSELRLRRPDGGSGANRSQPPGRLWNVL